MDAKCARCLTENPADRLFCRRCRAVLEPRNDLWLRLEDYQCSADRDALEILKSTGVLAYLVDQFLIKPGERKRREWLSREGIPSSRFKGMEALVENCAFTLSLANLPDVYMIQFPGPPNAFTFGNDDAPVIVIDRRLIQIMRHDELSALLGHEMGHIKSRHLLYHALASTLSEGVGISASLTGLGPISTAMRLALLAWHRESEFTADRTALISSSDPGNVASMFAKLLQTCHTSILNSSPLFQDVAKIFESHPNHLERAKAVYEFAKSGDYATIMEKIGRRKMFHGGFTSKCRFCSASKPIEALFCPECGKSQI